MARIAGVDIPREKKVPYSLCYIHGIGLTLAKNICSHAKVDEEKRVKDLTDNQVVAIRDAITALEIRVEGEQRSGRGDRLKLVLIKVILVVFGSHA